MITNEVLLDPELFSEQLSRTLSGRERRHVSEEGLRKSAVLVPLCWVESEPHVILTRRSRQVRHHQGEISFPGGRQEPDDQSLIATALRETWEEVGVRPEHVRVCGLLDDYSTLFGFHITPVVGLVPYPYDFQINVESDALLFVPLAQVLAHDTWMFEVMEVGDNRYNIYYLERPEGVIWGATGKILKLLADLLSGAELPAGELTASARQWVEEVVAVQQTYREFKNGGAAKN